MDAQLINNVGYTTLGSHPGIKQEKKLGSNIFAYFNIETRQKSLSFLLQEIHVLVKYNCEPTEITCLLIPTA